MAAVMASPAFSSATKRPEDLLAPPRGGDEGLLAPPAAPQRGDSETLSARDEASRRSEMDRDDDDSAGAAASPGLGKTLVVLFTTKVQVYALSMLLSALLLVPVYMRSQLLIELEENGLDDNFALIFVNRAAFASINTLLWLVILGYYVPRLLFGKSFGLWPWLGGGFVLLSLTLELLRFFATHKRDDVSNLAMASLSFAGLLVGLYISGRMWERSAEIFRYARHSALWASLLIILLLLYVSIVPILFLNSGSDTERALLRLCLHPLIFETFAFATRCFSRHLRDAHNAKHLEILLLSANFLASLYGRFLVANLSSRSAQFYTTFLLAGIDALLRVAITARDVALWYRPRYGSAVARNIVATDRRTGYHSLVVLVDEIAEAAAIIVAAGIVVTFRVSVSEESGQAPPVEDSVTLALFALGMEAAIDVLVSIFSLALGHCGSGKRRRKRESGVLAVFDHLYARQVHTIGVWYQVFRTPQFLGFALVAGFSGTMHIYQTYIGVHYCPLVDDSGDVVLHFPCDPRDYSVERT